MEPTTSEPAASPTYWAPDQAPETPSPYRAPQSTVVAPFTRKPGNAIGVIREAWDLLLRYPGVFAGAFLAIWIPLELIATGVEREFLEPDDFSGTFKLQKNLDLWVGVIASSAVIWVASIIHAGGQPTIGGALKKGYECWSSMIWARILYGLALAAGLLALILPAFYVAIRLLLIDHVVTLEGKMGSEAIKRTWALGRNRWIYIFRVSLLAQVVALLPIAVLVIVWIGATEFFPVLDSFVMDWIIGTAGSLCGSFPILCFYCLYRELAASEKLAGTSPAVEPLQFGAKLTPG